MKRIKILATIALSTLVLASCGEKLNVHNPNYFTEDEMNAYLKENPTADASIISGLCANLYNYITVYDAATNGGYSNTGAYESYKEFSHLCQTGDIVEGDKTHAGVFSKWYQNLASNTYWERTQEVDCYGYYYNAVLKVNPAQKALDYLPASKVKERPELAQYRAQALTLKALAYMQLMERFTKLDAATIASETAQGWPVYEEYAYSNPKEPLSAKATWAWVNRQFEEADSLFKVSSLGNQGYTLGKTNTNELFDIDRGVCQYYRCRAALESREWAIVIKAGEELLAQYPGFIPAASYGMPATALAGVQRGGVDATHEYGTYWMGEYTADLNGLINNKLNPETIFGNGDATSTTQFWSVLALNAVKATPSGYYQMDKSLYDSMSSADCRKACVLSEEFKDNYIIEKISGTDTTFQKYNIPAYTSLKWGATCGLGQTKHESKQTNYANSSWLRKSAVLLMVAEAYAQNGNTAKAKEWLDKLLEARTLPGMTPMKASSGSLDEVKTQWRLEMWGEGDWAFYNCKRWGETTFPRGSNHWSTTGVPTSGWVWEIPQKERQGNPYWD